MHLTCTLSSKSQLVFILVILSLFIGNNSFAQNDTSQKVTYKVNDIILFGNTTTKNNIIIRELTFKKGDLIDTNIIKKEMAQSRDNIYNTSLFNKVDVTYYPFGNHEVNVVIFLKERWYLWPVPIFEIHERNFNEWWLTKNFHRAVYGGYLIYRNFRGRNETLQLSVREGYYQSYSLNYTIPYINKNQNTGLGFSVGYSNNYEIVYKVRNDSLQYYTNDSIKPLQEYYAEARLTKRSGLYNTHTFYIDYKWDKITDSVINLNHDYFLNSNNTEQYLMLSYNFESDYRDIKIYPLKGYYYNFMIQQLGFFQKDLNITYLKASFRKFWKLSDPFYLETGINGRLSSTYTKQPFFLQSALGYGNDFVRGYELYVINGQSYGLFKTELKWQIFRPKVFYIPFIPAEKFNSIPIALYLTAFGDLGYVRDNLYGSGNPLTNSFLPGAGIGLDYVSYYNIVWRFEYSINKMGERGFYLHFVAPL